MPNLTAEQQRKLKILQAVKTKGLPALLEYMFELEDKLDQEIPSVRNVMERIKGDDGKTPTDEHLIELIDSRMPEVQDGKDADEEYIISEVLRKMPPVRNGKDADENKIIRKVLSEVYEQMPDAPEIDYDMIINEVARRIPKPENGKDGSPDTGNQIVEKINKADDKIDASRIKNLPTQIIHKGGGGRRQLLANGNRLDSVDTINFGNGLSLSQNGNVLTVTSTGGTAPLAYFISDQFDGSTTEFTLPEYSSILQFSLRGWSPNGVLEPDTEYTETSTTTVALTSEVTAPVAGTTGFILYIPA